LLKPIAIQGDAYSDNKNEQNDGTCYGPFLHTALFIMGGGFFLTLSKRFFLKLMLSTGKLAV
jgi:hypothetical protein